MDTDTTLQPEAGPVYAPPCMAAPRKTAPSSPAQKGRKGKAKPSPVLMEALRALSEMESDEKPKGKPGRPRGKTADNQSISVKHDVWAWLKAQPEGVAATLDRLCRQQMERDEKHAAKRKR